MVAVGSNFFYTVTLPCTLWFLDKGKPETRRRTVLFLDARNVYTQVSRALREFTPKQIAFLANIIGGGTIFASVTKKDMQSLPVLSPSEIVQEEFKKLLSPGLKILEVLTRKNTILRQTRDLLLPKLISGELDVSDLAEQTPELVEASG